MPGGTLRRRPDDIYSSNTFDSDEALYIINNTELPRTFLLPFILKKSAGGGQYLGPIVI
jgi:hypothetical protein